MNQITAKQRRNVEREIGSICCAGCDGIKRRGFAFCITCINILHENGFLKFVPGDVVNSYMEALTFILSRTGQRLRKQAA